MDNTIRRIIDILRDGTWLSGERVVAYSRIAVGAYVLGVVLVLMTTQHWLDGEGRPIAKDFSSFWIAGSQALDGQAAAAYDRDSHARQQAALFGGLRDSSPPWVYPPVFLLVASILALLPYGVALAAWTLSTSAAYALCVRKILPVPGAAIAALAWPAYLVNLVFGQNGCLSAALLGGGLLLLETQPVAAGVLLGALCFKPQLALLVAPALLAGRQWRALLGMGATVGAAVFLSIVFFGIDAWLAFQSSRDVLYTLIAPAEVYPGRVTVFSALRLAGMGVASALWIQGLVAVAVLGIVMRVWNTSRSLSHRGAVLAAAIPLATPHAFAYDLPTSALAVAWLVQDALAGAFLPWERLVIGLACLNPFVSLLAMDLGFQAAPLIEFALLAICLRRALGAEPLKPG